MVANHVYKQRDKFHNVVSMRKGQMLNISMFEAVNWKVTQESPVKYWGGENSTAEKSSKVPDAILFQFQSELGHWSTIQFQKKME